MSALLKSFEGPDVQLLLDRIRAEVGPGAKIDGAEKIRVGGVLGFFAKEHFRVMVELPDPTGSEATDSPGVGKEGGRSSPPAGGHDADLQPSPVPPSSSAPRPTPAKTATMVAPDVFTTMAEATDDVNDIASVSTASHPVTVRAPETDGQMTTGTSVSESPVSESPIAGAPASDQVTESFDAVLTRVATSLATDPGDTGMGQAEPTTEDYLAATSPDIATKAAQFLAQTTPVPSGASAAPDGVASANHAASGGATSSEGSEPHDGLAEALGRVGLNRALVASVVARADNGLDVALLDALSGLVAAGPLPRSPGSLLVVVGAGGVARRVAGALADEMGVDPSGMAFASLEPAAYAVATGPLLVRSADEGAERAPGWRRAQAAVVVVDAGVGGTDRAWATHLIAALRPTAVWGVVDSTAKSEDITAWSAALGGLDALALENLNATQSPASALNTGIAVARLDGQPATAARWAAVIADRIGSWR